MPIAIQHLLLTQFSPQPPPMLKKRPDAASIWDTPLLLLVPITFYLIFLPSTLLVRLLTTVCQYLLDHTPKSALSTTQQVSHTSLTPLEPLLLELPNPEKSTPFQLHTVAGPPPNTAMDPPSHLPLLVPPSPPSPPQCTEMVDGSSNIQIHFSYYN